MAYIPRRGGIRIVERDTIVFLIVESNIAEVVSNRPGVNVETIAETATIAGFILAGLSLVVAR